MPLVSVSRTSICQSPALPGCVVVSLSSAASAEYMTVPSASRIVMTAVPPVIAWLTSMVAWAPVFTQV